MLTPSLAAAVFRLSAHPTATRRVAGDGDDGRRRGQPARRAATVALLAGVLAVDVLAGGPGRLSPFAPTPADPALPLATLLGRADPPPPAPQDSAPPRAPLEAYLVTSARDCSSNLGALDLLAREGIAPRIRLAAALVVVPRQHRDARAHRADTAALRTVREAIAARGLPAPDVRALDPPTALFLERLGYRTTPFLVVLDSAGTLRFATPPSLSFADYHRLARTLAAIAGDAR